MAVPIAETSFIGGELAPGLWGSVDLARFHNSAATMRNMWCSVQRGAWSRAGTAFVGFSKQTGRSYPPRLIPFQFSINQGLVLEFGNFYMRVISDGGFVTESPFAIEGVSQASPAVVTLSAVATAMSATLAASVVSATYAPADTITLAGGTETVQAVLTVDTTSPVSFALNTPATSGYYAPGDTVNLAGGVQITPLIIKVVTTQVVSASIVYGGVTPSVDGTYTLTPNTGTGTQAQISVTVTGNKVTAINSISNAGSYTSNPGFPTGNAAQVPMTGGGFPPTAGGTPFFNFVMGVKTFTVLQFGEFSANPAGGNFTQASTNGLGVGVTFDSAIMAPDTVHVSTPGSYTAVPSNPVSQSATSGSGVGATFNVVWSLPGSLKNGDWVYAQDVGGMTELNGQTFVLGGVTSSTVELFDVYGNPINSAGFPAWTSGGTLSRIYTLTTPYSEVDLDYLKFTQSADVMSLCCVNQQTGTEYPTYDLERFSDSNFTLDQITFTPNVLPPVGPSGSAAPSGDWDYQYVITAVSPIDGSESIASPIVEIDSAVDISSTAGTISLAWGPSPTPNVQYYNVYKAQPAYETPPPAGSLFGFAGQALGTQFNDSNIVADYSQVPPTHQNPFARGQVLGVTMIDQGAGYSQSTATATVNTNTGSGAVLRPIVVAGAIVGAIVVDPGTGYLPTDTVTFGGGGSGTGATATFTASATDGAIETTDVTAGGTGYAAPMVSAPTGTGAVFVPVVVGGVITAIYWSNSGTGYPTSGSLTITDSGGGGANATGTLQIGPQSGTYPGVPCYFQERRGYGYSLDNPDTYWFSQPGSFLNFDTRIPTIDSDAITGSPWSVEVNGIQFMITTAGGLLIFTGLSVWLLIGAGSFATNVQAISPSSQLVNPQPEIGCAQTVMPVKIDYDVLYLSSKDSIYFDLPYQLYALSWPIDITVSSSHLFTGYNIVQHAWCREPYKLLWAVRDDGMMLSLTWLKNEQVSGWTRHDTQGTFETCCAITEPPVDALYVATQRQIGSNNPYIIERMDNRLWSDAEDVWAVDCGFSLNQPQPAATFNCSSATGLGSITGFTGLVGGADYSAATTFTVIDSPLTANGPPGPGSGAHGTVTVNGSGAITNLTFAANGSGYLNPQFEFSDPAGSAGGSGASAVPILNNAATVTASAGVFSSGNVGSIIRAAGGIAKVVTYTDSQHVVVNILSPLTDTIPNSGGVVASQPAGTWTMTAPVSSVYVPQLAGATVTGLGDGNVIPPTAVAADGTLTLPVPASAVTIGFGFTAQLQSVYLDGGESTLQGQRKAIGQVTARVVNSRGISVGSNQPDGSAQSPIQVAPAWSAMKPVPDLGPMPYNALAAPLWTGDTDATPVQGGFQKPGQVALQQSNPLPMNIILMVPRALPGDKPEVQVSPKQNGRGR